MNEGFFSLGRWQGVPVLLHWTAPVAALFFTRFDFAPAAWSAYFLLIFIHELGHALVVKACGQKVESIELNGFGGLCRWSGRTGDLGRAAIAWGGVWAQLVLLAATFVAITVAGPPASPFFAQVVDVFTRINLWLIVINLIPIRPLDGAEAWRLFGILFRIGRLRNPPRLPPRKISGRSTVPAAPRDPEKEALFNKILSDLGRTPPTEVVDDDE